MRTTIVACCGVLSAAGLLLSGCSAKVETSTGVSQQSAITSDQLQKDLTGRLTKSGNTFKSVTCKEDLVGEVGKTARCDVSFSDTNNVEAVLTVTKVEGTTVDFDMTPAMTKEQVEKAVAALSSVPTVTCAAGLEGKVGASTKCETSKDGAPSKMVAEVAKVDAEKLGLELSVYLVLPRQKVEEVLMQKLNADGTPAETVECVDDVASKVGSVVECATVTGNAKTGYDVTVTRAESLDDFDVDYKPTP